MINGGMMANKEKNAKGLFAPSVLRLSDLPFLQAMGEIEDGHLHLIKSPKGYTLKTPVSIPLDKILALGQKGLAEYIIKSLSSQRPVLIPFVLENRSVVELAKYFLRYCSGSSGSLYGYVDRIWRYCRRAGVAPDGLMADVKDGNGIPNPERVNIHTKALEDYMAELQDSGLSPGRVTNYAKAVKTLYRISGVSIVLPYPLGRKTVVKDRAPTPEELFRLLDFADLRERVIISMLALGSFREGTLVKLRYRHVKHDLEAGVIPVHIHIESEITKGRYHDYDTFLGAEAVEFLKFYLDDRRKGSPDGKIPPEEIHDDSPLIRDTRFKSPRPIGEKQIYKLIHNLYFKAGLLAPTTRGYELKVHSLRKFFKTQLMSLGVQPDYIDYMMGHTIDTYHDIQMKGVEFLRSIYAAKGFSIRPKPRVSKVEQLREFCQYLGFDPAKILAKEAFAEPHRVYVSPQEFENHQAQVLSSAIKEGIKQEIIGEILPFLESPEIRRWSGGPAGIRTPDLNRRLAPGGCPTGYQPSAPAKLSYGPH